MVDVCGRNERVQERLDRRTRLVRIERAAPEIADHLVIRHGVASFRPVRAELTVAQRLSVVRGALLLAIWQVDYSEEGTPVLSSYEYHLADAFDFTVLRRGPGRRSS